MFPFCDPFRILKPVQCISCIQPFKNGFKSEHACSKTLQSIHWELLERIRLRRSIVAMIDGHEIEKVIGDRVVGTSVTPLLVAGCFGASFQRFYFIPMVYSGIDLINPFRDPYRPSSHTQKSSKGSIPRSNLPWV